MKIITCSMDYDEGRCLNAADRRIKYSNDEFGEWQPVCGPCADRQKSMITATTGLDDKKSTPTCDGCGREGDLDQRTDFPATRDGRSPMLCEGCQGKPMPNYYDLLAFVRDFHNAQDFAKSAGAVYDASEELLSMAVRAEKLLGKPAVAQKTVAAMKEKEADRGERLRKVFNKVCNKKNWKMPINAVIKKEDERETIEAILYMTGGGDIIVTATPAQKKKGLIRIEAPGYYAVVGS